MQPGPIIISSLDRLRRLAPGGFAVGLQVKFTTPGFMFETYPEAWREVYDTKGFMMVDPAVRWASKYEGVVDWNDLKGLDHAGVFSRAAAFGLVHGFSAAIHEGDIISVGGFARADRSFSAREVGAIHRAFKAMHDATREGSAIGSEDRAKIRQMSVVFTEAPAASRSLR